MTYLNTRANLGTINEVLVQFILKNDKKLPSSVPPIDESLSNNHYIEPGARIIDGQQNVGIEHFIADLLDEGFALVTAYIRTKHLDFGQVAYYVTYRLIRSADSHNMAFLAEFMQLATNFSWNVDGYRNSENISISLKGPNDLLDDNGNRRMVWENKQKANKIPIEPKQQLRIQKDSTIVLV